MTSESITCLQKHRPISARQIAQLIGQGCSSDDWSKVLVAAGFSAETVKSTRFSGEVKLGRFEKQVSFFGGVTAPTGISNATIHNCTVGDNVYISRVRNYIANYVIEDDVVIDNIQVFHRSGHRIVQAVFGGELGIFRKLRRFSR